MFQAKGFGVRARVGGKLRSEMLLDFLAPSYKIPSDPPFRSDPSQAPFETQGKLRSRDQNPPPRADFKRQLAHDPEKPAWVSVPNISRGSVCP
jgi:hypothetical protein